MADVYRNVFGETVSRARWREMVGAAKNRAELVAARLSRRDLLRNGLLTTGGYLVAKHGLSARWGSIVPNAQAASPPVEGFVDPLPIMPIKSPVLGLNPTPALIPNLAAGEARTRPHQAWFQFPPAEFYQVSQRAVQVSLSRSLPPQTMWGFDGSVPGPTYVTRYGRPILVRNVNQLPSDNGGFGIPSVSCTTDTRRRRATASRAISSTPAGGTTSTVRTSWLVFSRRIRGTATSTKP